MGIQRPEESPQMTPALLCVSLSPNIKTSLLPLFTQDLHQADRTWICSWLEGNTLPRAFQWYREAVWNSGRKAWLGGWALIQVLPPSPHPVLPPTAGWRKQQLLSCREHRHRSTWHCGDLQNSRPARVEALPAPLPPVVLLLSSFPPFAMNAMNVKWQTILPSANRSQPCQSDNVC